MLFVEYSYNYHEVMDILTAYSEGNGMITLTRMHERPRLEELRKTDKFFCAQCKGKMILKVGQVVIPHFAHVSANECSQAFSEGESADHLAGKQQLYDFFKNQTLTVQMEAPIKQIQQRPDLLVEDQYAIEFQCSPIHAERFEERNSGYAKVGIHAVWILRTPSTLNAFKDGVHLITLTKFQQLFIPHRPIYGHTLLTYDVNHEHFLYLSHLLPVSKNQFIAKVRKLPIKQQQFPFLSVNLPTRDDFFDYFNVYLKKRRQFLSSRIFTNRRGINDRFLRTCYEQRVRPDELPNWIGVPVRGAEFFTEHPVEWQTYLLSFLRQHGFDEGVLKRYMIEGKFHPESKLAVTNYLAFLKDVGINISSRDIWRQQAGTENLFTHLFHHFLAKRYEN